MISTPTEKTGNYLDHLENSPNFKDTLSWAKTCLPSTEHLRELSDALRTENLRKIEKPRDVEALLSETRELLDFISNTLESW